jgi:hypothetical protein
MPLVKKGSEEEVQPEDSLREEEIDSFLSTTASLTALVPFQAISDNQYIYIFRQSINKDHPDRVFITPEKKTRATRYPKKIATATLIVNNSLLVDRFVLVDTQLERKREVRYRRNRHKTKPQSKKDSLGAMDMNKQPFYEPTQELKFVGQLHNGYFTVLQLPTQLVDVKRWQIFTHNNQTDRIDSFNVERSPEGLFNTKGTQFYTSPDPEHQNEVFERQPGIDPFTKKPLIPILSKDGYAGSALQFDDRYSVELENSIDLTNSRNFTVEAWIQLKSDDNGIQTVVGIGDDSTRLLLGVKNLKAYLQWSTKQNSTKQNSTWSINQELTGSISLSKDNWYHIAWQYDQPAQKATVFINGVLDKTTSISLSKDLNLTTKIGMMGDEYGFNGLIDEVRIWNIIRPKAQIQADKHHRLVGNELGLVGYWRFDEKQGGDSSISAYDLTNNNNTGSIKEAEMVISNAPIGDHPGIRRTRFSLENNQLQAGLTALLYYQQEKVVAGHYQKDDPIKQNARVMLAMVTQNNNNAVAVLDFAVSREGKLAQVPGSIKLNPLNNNGQMKLLHTDPFGLTVSGGLLDFAHAQDTPYLFDSATSQLALYFREQASDQFRVAYFDTTTAKVKPQLDTTNGKLTLIACSADPEMDEISITVNNDNPNNSEFCKVEIRNANITETWRRVPREVQQFATVLNGSAKPEFIGLLNTNLSDEDQQLTLTSRAVNRSFEKGDILQVGRNTRVKIAEKITNEKSTTISIEAVTIQAEKGTSIHLQKCIGQLGEDLTNNAEQLTLNSVINRPLKSRDILWINSSTKVEVKEDVNQNSTTISINPSATLIKADQGTLVYQSNGNMKRTQVGKLNRSWSNKHTALILTVKVDSHTFSENDILWVGEDVTVKVNKLNNTSVTVKSNQSIEIPIDLEDITFKANNQIYLPEIFIGQLDTDWNSSTNAISLTPSKEDEQEWSLSLVPNDRLRVGHSIEMIVDESKTINQEDEPTTLSVKDAIIKLGAQISFIPYDYQELASTNRVGDSLQNGSLLLKVVPKNTKAEEKVENQELVKGEATTSCHWQTQTSSDYALSFENNRFGTHQNQNKLTQFDATQGDVTLEAWVRPSYNNANLALIIHHYSNQSQSQSQYTLGLQHQEHQSALQLLKNVRVEISNESVINFESTQNFTVETWVKIVEPNANGVTNIIGKWDESSTNNSKYPYALCYDNSTNKIQARRKGQSGGKITLTSTLNDDKFHHLAFVKNELRLLLYVDGKKQEKPDEKKDSLTGTNNDSSLYFGSQNGAIEIEEVRIWNLARTQMDIEDGMERYLKGNEPGLVGYWYFFKDENGGIVAKNRTNQGNLDGTFQGAETKTLVNSPIPQYTFFAKIDKQFKQSTQPITGTGWEHLAAVYNQSYGLKFQSSEKDYLDCGNNSTLNLQDLTIEVILQLDDLSKRCGIVSKGTLDFGEPEQNLPYALYTEDETVVFVFEDDVGNQYESRCAVTKAARLAEATKLEAEATKLEAEAARLEEAETEKLKAKAKELKAKVEKLRADAEKGNNLSSESVHKITVTRKKCTEPATASGDDLGIPEEATGAPNLTLGNKTWADVEGKDADINKSMNADYLASKQRGKKLQDLQSETESSDTTGMGSSSGSFPSGTQVTQWTEIKIYLDGYLIHSESKGPVNPGYNNQPLEIGKFSDHYFDGTICEVRLWNQALEQSDINQNQSGLKGREQGLMAWWRFEENESQIAYDSKGNNHASIKGAKWVKNPDPQSSPLVLYRNGVPVATLKARESSDAENFWTYQQFTLGARRTNTTATEYFKGKIDEVRVWKVARTQEQIQDNLFSRLKDEKESLIANYTFDNKESELKDHSLLGNHLTWNGDQDDLVLSTAPISNDTALVHPVGAVDTQFHGTIQSCPVIQEYADTQTNADGDMIGVMKRCYAYIKDGQWHLLTGFKVGNLITEWISQVQFNPQVIGYIEGAPPVPSENLTAGPIQPTKGDYSGGAYSALEVVEAESVNYNFSVSKERGIDTSFEVEAQVGGAFDTRILLAPLGFGTSFKLKGSFTGDFKGNLEASNSWVNEQSGGAGKNTTKSTTVAMGGNWEDEKLPLNPTLGRRYQPANMGFALVRSETADVFALRLDDKDKALVAFRFLPNPDIPKDVNLIPFPINPRYTKQGTLDGAVGYNPQGKVCDPDYPNAKGYGEYSYFKPIEAYALKQKIQREEQELKTYYENFDTSPPNSKIEDAASMGAAFGSRGGAVGAGIGAAIGAWGQATFGGLGEALSNDKTLPEKFAKRNFVNTYVWTADGGLYAESTEFTEIKQETTSTSYDFAGMAGAGVSVELEAPVIFNFSMNAMMGGHLNTTKTKSQESQNSFSINVTVDPPGDLQQYQKEEGDKVYTRVYDAYGNPITVEGKMNAYRFMTFYLEPTKENFDDLFNKVIDPIWLSQSGHHDAIALQQAKVAEKKPPCWRVMHRVTFVSRILPSFPDETAAPMEHAMKAENIESNWELIKKLEPFVRDKTDDYVTFSDAVRNTLKTYLPELEPHESDIIKYAAAYFGVQEEV